jgi:hypothetical protein
MVSSQDPEPPLDPARRGKGAGWFVREGPTLPRREARWRVILGTPVGPARSWGSEGLPPDPAISLPRGLPRRRFRHPLTAQTSRVYADKFESLGLGRR